MSPGIRIQDEYHKQSGAILSCKDVLLLESILNPFNNNDCDREENENYAKAHLRRHICDHAISKMGSWITSLQRLNTVKQDSRDKPVRTCQLERCIQLWRGSTHGMAGETTHPLHKAGYTFHGPNDCLGNWPILRYYGANRTMNRRYAKILKRADTRGRTER